MKTTTMKRLFTLAISFALIGGAYSQSQRLVLIEEATNASCGPCAQQNPNFNTLLAANTNKVVSIKYQWWFPGYDPMFEHNPTQIINRVDYYGINGVPTAVLDGEIITSAYPGFDSGNLGWYEGAPGGYSQATIDNAYAVPASFDIDIDYTISPDGITVTPTATCTQDVSGDLKLHIAIVEKEIHFDTPPGANGESHFENVMKKMLPDENGTAMAESYTVGETFSVTESWNFANVYDVNEIAVVVFIQDDATKEVLQAGFNDSEEFNPVNNNDAAAIEFNGLPDYACDPEVSPSIEIRNHGADNLTSLTIDYTLNDASGTVEWTGDLPFYESEMVPLGDITFTPGAENILEVTLSNPNGNTDENAINDVFQTEVKMAAVTTLDIVVQISTDYYPGETSWELTNSAGEIVASHQYEGPTNGGGQDANAVHNHPLMLDPFDCYTFTLFDDYGDGMKYIGNGQGTTTFGYRIYDGNGDVVVQDMASSFDFGDQTSNAIRTENSVDISEADNVVGLSVYPNPASSRITVELELSEAQEVSVLLYNSVGQLVRSVNAGQQVAGATKTEISVADLAVGMYMLQVNTPNSQTTRKITITRE